MIFIEGAQLAKAVFSGVCFCTLILHSGVAKKVGGKIQIRLYEHLLSLNYMSLICNCFFKLLVINYPASRVSFDLRLCSQGSY